MLIIVSIPVVRDNPKAIFWAPLRRLNQESSSPLGLRTSFRVPNDRASLTVPCTDALKNMYHAFAIGPSSPDLLKFTVIFLESSAAFSLLTPAFLASIYAARRTEFSNASFTFSITSMLFLAIHSDAFFALLFSLISDSISAAIVPTSFTKPHPV